MKHAYVLNLYYKSVKEQVHRIEHMKKIIKAEAGTSWRVLAYGEHICTIGFISDGFIDEGFARDLGLARDEDFCYVVFRVESMPCGHIFGDAAGWFGREVARLARERSA